VPVEEEDVVSSLSLMSFPVALLRVLVVAGDLLLLLVNELLDGEQNAVGSRCRSGKREFAAGFEASIVSIIIPAHKPRRMEALAMVAVFVVLILLNISYSNNRSGNLKHLVWRGFRFR